MSAVQNKRIKNENAKSPRVGRRGGRCNYICERIHEFRGARGRGREQDEEKNMRWRGEAIRGRRVIATGLVDGRNKNVGRVDGLKKKRTEVVGGRYESGRARVK